MTLSKQPALRIFKVMAIQTRVAPAELWLRDDLENIYALLFRFLGFGFRLAMSNVGWHVTRLPASNNSALESHTRMCEKSEKHS